ncbi:MAG TPA: hypothetical protein VMM57_03090 [Bacteroidota bacterium]|nr:hypothetical protein [Bacteroidota bacterium]
MKPIPLFFNLFLVVCLVYEACEDQQFMPRERRIMPPDPKSGLPRPWPEPKDGERAGGLPKR